MKSVDPSASFSVAMPPGNGVEVGVGVGVDVAIGLGVDVSVGVNVRVGVEVAVAKKLDTSETPQDKLAIANADTETNKYCNPLFFPIIDSSLSPSLKQKTSR